MQPIQSLIKTMSYSAQLKCDDFDRIKAYVVLKNEGNVYVIKRLKISEINLETLKKLGSMIEKGQIWLKKGNKFEDKKFVGIGIQQRKIESIIVEKSDDKYGKRESRTINKNDIHVEEMSQDEATEIAKRAEDLVVNVFEQKQKMQGTLVRPAPIKEEVKPAEKQDISTINLQSNVKNALKARQRQDAKLQEESNIKSRKKKRNLQKEAEELDKKSDDIRNKSVKIEDKHEVLLKKEIKNRHIKQSK